MPAVPMRLNCISDIFIGGSSFSTIRFSLALDAIVSPAMRRGALNKFKVVWSLAGGY